MTGIVEGVIRYGLEYVFQRYYGLYRGEVVDSADPEKRGRVRVLVPSVHRDTAPKDAWFEPVFLGAGGGRGTFWPPEPGDSVRVSFDNGDPQVPGIYLGGWYGEPNGKPDLPTAVGYGPTGLPERRGFVTRGGHSLVLDDTQGQEGVRLIWHKMADDDPAQTDRTAKADLTKGKLAALAFTDDGSLVITLPSGDTFHMSVKNKSIQLIHPSGKNSSAFFLTDKGWQLLAPDGSAAYAEDGSISMLATKNINLAAKGSIFLKGNVFLGEGAAQSIPLGEALNAWLAAHVHTSGPPGSPTSPPLTIAALVGILSKKLKGG